MSKFENYFTTNNIVTAGISKYTIVTDDTHHSLGLGLFAKECISDGTEIIDFNGSTKSAKYSDLQEESSSNSNYILN